MDMYRVIGLALVFVSLCAASSEGPFAPTCSVCPEYVTPPYPHTGLWHNPYRSGTGINIDIQSGIATVVYYGYQSDGKSIWYIASDKLAQTEQQGIYWTLEADLIQTAHGEPVNGDYQLPEYKVAGRLHLEVLQRHLIRFSIDNGPAERMVPLMFGSHSIAAFESFDSQFDFRIPSFEEGKMMDVKDSQPYTPWMIVEFNQKTVGLGGQGSSRWGYAFTKVFSHWGRLVVDGSEPESVIKYNFSFFDYWAPMNEAITIACGTIDRLTELYEDRMAGMGGDELLCIAWSSEHTPPDEERTYFMPIGNIGDRRFSAVSEDGWVLEGFRLSYD